MKFNRTSTKYLEVEDKVSKGNLKAAYILTYQHSVGFDDGKHNLYGAYKLENIVVQEKLPDSFFPFVNNFRHRRSAVCTGEKGFSFYSNSTFEAYS